MSENLDQPQQQPSFIDAVIEALERLHFKPKCSGCSAIGWANFNVFDTPVCAPVLFSDQVMPAACLICQKCGQINLKHLRVLGISVSPQQRMVLTASEVAQQQQGKPLIVTG